MFWGKWLGQGGGEAGGGGGGGWGGGRRRMESGWEVLVLPMILSRPVIEHFYSHL